MESFAGMRDVVERIIGIVGVADGGISMLDIPDPAVLVLSGSAGASSSCNSRPESSSM
jgi:hypothetical protein